MLYNRCTRIYKFGNNTYPGRIRRRSNLGHIFRGKKCVLRAGKYSISRFHTKNTQPFLIVSRAGFTSIHHVKIQKSWNPLWLVYWMTCVYTPSSDHHMHSVNTESHKQEIQKQFSKTAFNLKSETRKKVKYIYIYIYLTTWLVCLNSCNNVHSSYNSIIRGHLSKQNSYVPYVSVMVSFPFGSRTVATGALYVAEPYRWTAASKFLGRPDGTWGKSSY